MKAMPIFYMIIEKVNKAIFNRKNDNNSISCIKITKNNFLNKNVKKKNFINKNLNKIF